MTALSDTLTVSLVLILLFGSIALYLYTRIQQAEQKINLLESILLDMKMSSEVKSHPTYTSLPASEMDYDSSEDDDIHSNTSNKSESRVQAQQQQQQEVTTSVAEYKPLDDDDIQEDITESVKVEEKASVDDVDFYKSVLTSDSENQTSSLSVNYEAMNIKELHSLAKQRGISGATTMKKQAIIEALKTNDRKSNITEPGSLGTSSFLETSTFLGGQEDKKIMSSVLTIED